METTKRGERRGGSERERGWGRERGKGRETDRQPASHNYLRSNFTHFDFAFYHMRFTAVSFVLVRINVDGVHFVLLENHIRHVGLRERMSHLIDF